MTDDEKKEMAIIISDLCNKLRAFAIISKRDEFNDAAFLLEGQESDIVVLECKLRDTNDILIKANKQQDDLREEIRQLNSRITKLMIALKPFSDAWDEKETWRWQINIDDLRAARAALGEKK